MWVKGRSSGLIWKIVNSHLLSYANFVYEISIDAYDDSNDFKLYMFSFLEYYPANLETASQLEIYFIFDNILHWFLPNTEA
jgi:hypothetical protein